jgi:hypothetical protein
MENGTRNDQINSVLVTQKQLIALLESVADIQDWQPNPQEWSFRYIAAHLATVDRDCYRDRIIRISAGENPNFLSYFNSGWDFSHCELVDSLHEWAITRQEMIDFVSALPEDTWQLTGNHSAFGTITVLDVFKMMHNHDNEHIDELRQMISRCKLQEHNSQP